MLEISNKTNLLEQESYRYSLQDIPDPNLYRDVFNYTEVPKIPFNHRRVPMGMPKEVWITDTTFRDGQQAIEPYSVKQIVDLFKLMSKLGGPYGIIRQTEFFVYSEKDRKALAECQDLGLTFPEITTWIRASKEDFKLVKDLGIRETGILLSCSDYHIFNKMHKTRGEIMRQYLSTVDLAFESGVMPRCHLEDITRADFYGFVLPLVNELTRMSEQAGSRCASGPAIRWATVSRTRKSHCPGASPASSTVCSIMRAFRAKCWSGTVTTTSTRVLRTRRRPGSTAPAA